MAKVKKMAFGGIGSMAGNAANQAKQQAMAAGAPPRGPVKQANPFGMGMSQDTSALNKIGQTNTQAKPMGGGAGQAANMAAAAAQNRAGAKPAQAAPKTGLGTATNMKTLAGMGAALGKKPGMKSGGAVGSASKRADGIAAKGKTKGRVC